VVPDSIASRFSRASRPSALSSACRCNLANDVTAGISTCVRPSSATRWVPASPLTGCSVRTHAAVPCCSFCLMPACSRRPRTHGAPISSRSNIAVVRSRRAASQFPSVVSTTWSEPLFAYLPRPGPSASVSVGHCRCAERTACLNQSPGRRPRPVHGRRVRRVPRGRTRLLERLPKAGFSAWPAGMIAGIEREVRCGGGGGVGWAGCGRG
jgi:hypothetical protein